MTNGLRYRDAIERGTWLCIKLQKARARRAFGYLAVDAVCCEPVSDRSAPKKVRRWNQMLLDGKLNTLTDLARQERRDLRYLYDLIKLAHQAPDIQNAILASRIPTDLTLDKLKKSVPDDWNDQRRMPGFDTWHCLEWVKGRLYRLLFWFRCSFSHRGSPFSGSHRRCRW